MTPRMLDALLKRKERERLDTEFLFGQLSSLLVNYSMAAPKKAVAPADFMPSEMLKQIAKRRKGPTKEERLAIDAQVREFFMKLKKAKEQGESGEAKIHHS